MLAINWVGIPGNFAELGMRLIDDGSASGAWNMAFDEAMLEALIAGEAPPTLRFYSWSPAAVSLGYAQDMRDIDLMACQRLGIEVVRRITGGRAVLHTGELTYAITGYASNEPIVTSYRRIAQAIALAIQSLGAPAVIEPGKERDIPRSANCFAARSRADLVVGSRKLAGAAQLRRRGCFLQHGSIKLLPTPPVSQTVFFAPGPDPITLAELLNGCSSLSTSQDHLVNRLKRAIAAALSVAWQPGSPSSWELERAAASVAQTSDGPLRFDRLRHDHPVGD
ncbi:MAG: lipoate--protein ligase family protein [Cyanobacteria bacterium NC_groundwater_1444_Ag_S-0.65um_54_12]|nr:lipoate--protein ligase family protein [Cyanobacteria bacterium NC_groundwater_1444_Ag_S-0.65um_54_12]